MKTFNKSKRHEVPLAGKKLAKAQLKDLEVKKNPKGGDGNWGSALTFKPSKTATDRLN